jgi:phosphoglycerate dehydrogenase-like enzyme
MAHRVLAIDTRYLNPIWGELVLGFMGEGYELVLPEPFEYEQFEREAATACAIITGRASVTAELIAAAPNLKAIGRGGIGLDAIDVEAATAAGVAVVNAPTRVLGVALAEHAFTFMLTLSRRPWLWWDKPVPHNMLDGTTLGIVGLGTIGREVAGRGAAFGMDVLVHTRTRGKFHPEGYTVEETGTLDELLPRVDYLVLSLPLTEETHHCIGAKELSSMKKESFLVNVARGGLVDTDALVASLREGHTAGAGLDVTVPEPLPDTHPLRQMPNAMISPHIGGITNRTLRATAETMCRNVRMAVEGKRPDTIVNAEIYDS